MHCVALLQQLRIVARGRGGASPLRATSGRANRTLPLRGIDVALAFEVLDEVLAPASPLAGAMKVVRSDRRFAVPARNVEHVSRLTKPGEPAAQRTRESLALLDGRLPVRGARRQVTVVKIVRLYAALDQGAHELTQCLCIVVDAAQQHGLAQHWDSG